MSLRHSKRPKSEPTTTPKLSSQRHVEKNVPGKIEIYREELAIRCTTTY